MGVLIRRGRRRSKATSHRTATKIIIDLRCLQDSALAPGVISRARYLVTLARLVYPPALAARLVAIIDPALPPLDRLAEDAVDEIVTNAYIPELGPGSLFIGLAALASDQLFVARLLLRPDIYKVAMLEDFASIDNEAPSPSGTAEALALAANKLWLKRYDILIPYADVQTHPEVMARDIWQTIGTQMKRAAMPYFAVGGRRPRIALISPLPPARSGVADYSAALAEELALRADITLFAPGSGAKAESLSHLPYIARRFDRVVSVMGNSQPFHGGIHDFLLRYGGACICHDARLSGFYEQKIGTLRMAAMATAETGKPVSQDEIDAWLNDETMRGANFLDEIAGIARPLILHGYQSAAGLNARGFSHVQHLPFAIYRPWKSYAVSERQRRAARERLGFRPDEKVIVSFGFITPSKGIEAALQAMVLLRERNITATLIWAGPFDCDIWHWRQRAAALGVAPQVIFIDQFIAEETYRDYLLAADAGLQLRSAGTGNISGALQDCIAAGLPGVANADLAGALNAPFYITRVADRLDGDDIATALAAILNERPNTELARADYAAARSMAAYAEGLCRLLELG